MNPQMAQTLRFLNENIGIFPIEAHGKRPEFSMLPIDANDLKPTWEPYKTTLPKMSEVIGWFNHGLENYAVISGWSNLVILDFDDGAEYASWARWAQRGQISAWVYKNAYKVRTARGVHVYVRTATRERARKLGKIDIKAAGGYVVGPGSIHPSGIVYTALSDNLFFPLVATLGDILPKSILSNDPTIPVPPQTKPPQPVDPWQAASTQIPSANPDAVKKIKANFHIEDFFPGATDSGDHHKMTCCPFHPDRHPSFWIDTRLQICGCFSGCNGPKPWDVINVYARLHSLSNNQAILSMAGVL
jgi:hypothetical protein